MNWEFLVGLLVPAFGMGFAWLAKLAREDSDMYKVVERSLRFWSLALCFASLISFVDAAQDVHISKEFRLSSMVVFLSMTVFFASTFGSTYVFRRIVKLPPKQRQRPSARL